MEFVYIELIEVKKKWFYMDIFTENKRITLKNSFLFQNDAPYIFIKNLYELSLCENNTRYLRWEEEGYSDIWILEKNGDNFQITIWEGTDNLITIFEGDEVLREKRIKLLFTVKTSFYYFVQNVINEFEKKYYDKETESIRYFRRFISETFQEIISRGIDKEVERCR